MKEFKYTITDPEGIHARPAGMLVKKVKEYTSAVTIEHDGKSAKGGALLAIMAMGIKTGMEVTVKADGDDEEAAIAGLEEFFKSQL